MHNIQTATINTITNKLDKDVLITEKDINHSDLDNVGTLTHAELEEAINAIANVNDKYYEHEQITPSSTWTITHNLNKYPAVNVKDSSNSVVYGKIEYTSLNQLKIYFNASFSGWAYCN